jgi:hypothetical protein
MQIIDALFVTLGIDGSAFIKGAAAVKKVETELDKNAKKTATELEATKRRIGRDDSGRGKETIKREKDIADVKRKQDIADVKRAKDANTRSADISNGIKKLRNDALTFLAVFTGGVGLLKFATDTITTAANLGRLSDNLDISTERLTAWQQAATRAGGSGDGILAQLKASQNNVAAFRLSQTTPENLAFFKYHGQESALKTPETDLKARADIVAEYLKSSPSLAPSIANQLGISDDQYNLIKQGSVAIETLIASRLKYSQITKEDTANAEALRLKMLDLTDAFKVTGQKLLLEMAPAITYVLGKLGELATWITDHRHEIAQWIEETVKKVVPLLTKLGNALATTDWDAAVRGAKSLGMILNGIATSITVIADKWNSVFNHKNPDGTVDARPDSERAFGFSRDPKKDGQTWNAAKAPAWGKVATPTNAKYQSFIDKVKAQGWTAEQAAGITGSLTQESGLDPNAVNPISGARGIAQWLGPRVKDFKRIMGKDLAGSSLDEQLAFHQWELTHTEKAAGDRMRASNVSQDVATIHSRYYERPKAIEANNARREALAGQLLNADRARSAAGAASLPAAASAAPVPTAGAGSTNTSSAETHIGKIEISTAATDAAGIARDIGAHLRRFSIAPQMNTGLA